MTLSSQLSAINKIVFEKHKKPTAVIGTIIIIVATALLFQHSADSTETVSASEVLEKIEETEGGKGGALVKGLKLVNSSLDPITGSSTENSKTPVELTKLKELPVASISAKLTWEDEEPPPLYTNEPDKFGLKITSPSGEVKDVQATGDGEVTLEYEVEEETFETGEWTVTVICEECGDEVSRGPFGLISNPDDGNDWELTVKYGHYEKE